MRVNPSALFFWAAAAMVGSLEPLESVPCTQQHGGGRQGRGLMSADEIGSSVGELGPRRAWQVHSTLATSSCASEMWKINTSELTVTSGFLSLVGSCAASVSGTETVAPTALLLKNSTFRIAPGEKCAPHSVKVRACTDPANPLTQLSFNASRCSSGGPH